MGRKQLPLCLQSEPTREDGIFPDLWRALPKPHTRERRKNGWISEDTWRLVDVRVYAQQKIKDESRIQRLSRAIVERLKGDRRRRVAAAGEEVEALLGADPPMPR